LASNLKTSSAGRRSPNRDHRGGRERSDPASLASAVAGRHTEASPSIPPAKSKRQTRRNRSPAVAAVAQQLIDVLIIAQQQASDGIASQPLVDRSAIKLIERVVRVLRKSRIRSCRVQFPSLSHHVFQHLTQALFALKHMPLHRFHAAISASATCFCGSCSMVNINTASRCFSGSWSSALFIAHQVLCLQAPAPDHTSRHRPEGRRTPGIEHFVERAVCPGFFAAAGVEREIAHNPHQPTGGRLRVFRGCERFVGLRTLLYDFL